MVGELYSRHDRPRNRDGDRNRHRSRSRSRERRVSRSRSRSPSRGRRRDGGRRRHSRSRSADRKRRYRGRNSRSRSPNTRDGNERLLQNDKVGDRLVGGDMKVNKDSNDDGSGQVPLDAELTPEEIRMMSAMGIPFSFDSTQGKHVDDENANSGAVKVASKRRARQFMNRRGGFNRPLPAERTGEKVRRD